MTVTVQLDAVKRRADDVSLQNLIFDENGDIDGQCEESDALDNVNVDLDLADDVELDNLRVTN